MRMVVDAGSELAALEHVTRWRQNHVLVRRGKRSLAAHGPVLADRVNHV